MRTLSEILIAKLFNNPLGRWYLGVPKGKKIYKITRSSAHYYTGEFSKRNGLPIICTGGVSPNGRNRFIYWLETWKPIHLCWLFIRMGWKIPKYFIGLDTGLKSPTATGTPSNDWTNPTNAYASDNAYTTATQSTSVDKKQSYKTFGFGVPAGATIDGIEATVEGYRNVSDNPTSLYCEIFDQSAYRVKVVPLALSEATYTLGGAADLWSGFWIADDMSDANFEARLNLRWEDPADLVATIDHIQVKVYYTEATGSGNTNLLLLHVG